MSGQSKTRTRARFVAVLFLGAALFGSRAVAVEEPSFKLKLREGAFEVRDYPARIVAEVTVEGDQKSAASAGFRVLAGYIFGGNRRRQSLPMTAPVAQRQTSQTIAMTAPVAQTQVGGSWVVQFTMPGDYTLETLPEPNDQRIRLRRTEAARVAVIRFSGLANPSDVAVQTTALHGFIRQRHWRAIGPDTLAQYDPPWTPWFMRRNEVMIPISP
jgi:hypothetical protein